MRPREFAPWLDRGGRLSALKATVFAALLLPALSLAAQFAAGTLGARPVNALIHGTGLWTVRLLLVTLAVTPLRSLGDWPRVTVLRRMLGVAAMAYALAHITLYTAQQNWRPLVVALEIARRFYLTIGFVALLGLVVLGITSTDGWLRRLGRRWKTLHRAVYGIAVLALLHYFLQSKADVSGAVLATGFFLWLMAWRRLPARLRTNLLALLALAPCAVAATALVEYVWYATRTRLPAWRVLEANLSLAFGPRPAVWVGIAALGVVVLALLAPLRRRLSRRGGGGPRAAVARPQP